MKHLPCQATWRLGSYRCMIFKLLTTMQSKKIVRQSGLICPASEWHAALLRAHHSLVEHIYLRQTPTYTSAFSGGGINSISKFCKMSGLNLAVFCSLQGRSFQNAGKHDPSPEKKLFCENRSAHSPRSYAHIGVCVCVFWLATAHGLLPSTFLPTFPMTSVQSAGLKYE